MEEIFKKTGLPYVAAYVDGTSVKLQNKPKCGSQDYWCRKSKKIEMTFCLPMILAWNDISKAGYTATPVMLGGQ